MAALVTARPLAELVSLRSFSALLSRALGSRGLAAAAGHDGPSSSGSQDSPGAHPEVDTKHRSATEVIWPASKHQERFASRLHTALSAVLLDDLHLRDALVQQLGFAVKEVRMSPDNLKAFIQWDSCTGHTAALERELRRQRSKLRSAVARALKARNAPSLVFVRDAPTDEQREIESIFAQLDEEAAADAAAADAAAAPGGERWGGPAAGSGR